MFVNPQLHGEFKARLCYVRHHLQRKERSGGSEGAREAMKEIITEVMGSCGKGDQKASEGENVYGVSCACMKSHSETHSLGQFIYLLMGFQREKL